MKLYKHYGHYVNGCESDIDCLEPITIPKGTKINATGVACLYVPLRKTIGLKLYYEKPYARKALKFQRKAWSIGAAPKPLSDKPEKYALQLHRTGGRILFLWGYKTQVAEKAGKIKNKEKAELVNKLQVIGLGEDTHSGNFGRINDKLVFIDFGEESVQYGLW